MIFPDAQFSFRPPPTVVRARRVLIKPYAPYPIPYPATTSREILLRIIEAIRRVSDADIILLEGHPEGKPMAPIYKALGWDFPRVMTLDVRDSLWVEIDNPLSKPFALASVWVPNVVLSCDFWISVSPFLIRGRIANFTIHNLIGLLAPKKYRPADLEALGWDRVIADLYFTIPFDLGIIDGRQKLTMDKDSTRWRVEELGQIFMGEPFEVDVEAANLAKLKPEFVELIKAGKAELEG